MAKMAKKSADLDLHCFQKRDLKFRKKLSIVCVYYVKISIYHMTSCLEVK